VHRRRQTLPPLSPPFASSSFFGCRLRLGICRWEIWTLDNVNSSLDKHFE
jgi:hypothetical protein